MGGSEQCRQAEVKLVLRSEPEAGGQGRRTVGDSLPPGLVCLPSTV